MALSCPLGVGLHVAEDMVIIEVVDEHGAPVPAGTPGHRLLLTNLANLTQPLIRYELTDSVTMADGPNPAGMPWQRIAAVGGRTGEILRLPGRNGDVRVHPTSCARRWPPTPTWCSTSSWCATVASSWPWSSAATPGTTSRRWSAPR
ncbi:hypothetical protein [Nocardioides sp.]|uniref:hypothetical protein n=1 Tax=Nocardioides sp. TaxID=35761 RepID=UPI003526E756